MPSVTTVDEPDLENGAHTRPQFHVPPASIANDTLPDVPMVLVAAFHKLPA